MSGSSVEEARERCRAALSRKWSEEEKEEPETWHRYFVEFDCSYETYQEILLAIRAHPTANRRTRMLPPERG